MVIHESFSVQKTLNKMPTIAFVCNGFPIVSETFITNQISHALASGYRVEIHADYFNRDDYYFLPKTLLQKNLIENLSLNITIPEKKPARIFIAISSALRTKKLAALFKSLNPLLFKSNGLNLRNFFSISSFLDSAHPDLIHAHFGPNGVKAVNAKLLGLINCPIITSFHGYDAHFTDQTKNPKREYYRALFKHGDLFLVNGNYLQNQLMELGCPKHKIEVLRLGIDLKLFATRKLTKFSSEKNIKLITVGRLVAFKNQRLGIHILKWLRKRGWSASYTLVGDGPEKENLIKLADELGVSDHVLFLGKVGTVEISNILAEHDIFLMTSDKDKTGRVETQGLVTAEAQASGLPVLALGTGGTADTIKDGETGFLIANKTENQIIELISELMKPENYQKFSEAAVNFVHREFDLEKTQINLTQTYNGLLKK